jgi:hypothetical protein
MTIGPPGTNHFPLDSKVLGLGPAIDVATFILFSDTFKKDIEGFFSTLAKAPGCTVLESHMIMFWKNCLLVKR